MRRMCTALTCLPTRRELISKEKRVNTHWEFGRFFAQVAKTNIMKHGAPREQTPKKGTAPVMQSSDWSCHKETPEKLQRGMSCESRTFSLKMPMSYMTKDDLRRRSRLKELVEIWQLNVIPDPGPDGKRWQRTALRQLTKRQRNADY